jgi:hypothetical protein
MREWRDGRQFKPEGETMSLTELLQKLERERFYGTVEIRFKAGKVEIANQTQSILFREGNQTRDYNQR